MKKEDIKLKNAKTCNYCCAYAGSYCRLGYSTKEVSIEKSRTWIKLNKWEDGIITLVPDELCPKPKNRKEMFEISEVIDVYRSGRVNSIEYKKEQKISKIMTDEESLKHYINYKK